MGKFLKTQIGTTLYFSSEFELAFKAVSSCKKMPFQALEIDAS
ncbi:MAG: hypothetical protein ACYDEF_03930 [Methanosarcina sp.]